MTRVHSFVLPLALVANYGAYPVELDSRATPPASVPISAPTSADPAASPAHPVYKPVIVRIGTAAVLTLREPSGTQTVAERAAVVQSRIDQVLLHHPYLTWVDIKELSENGAPVIYWGAFPIIQVDGAHARANHFSSPDLLAHAWANSLRTAVKAFFAAKKMPERALFQTPHGNLYTYRRTDHVLKQPTLLSNTRFVFSPKDFDYGTKVTQPGQHGFVVFIKHDAAKPPLEIYLGNGQGTFTQYDWIRPEETP